MVKKLLFLKPGVYTFFAKPGAGKTTFAAAITYHALKMGIPVYSNVPISGSFKVSKDDIGKFNLPLLGSNRCILIIDEAGLDFDNRNFKTNFKDYQVSWWKLHRHYHCTVFIFSQSYEDMDKKLRVLTQRYYLLTKTIIPKVVCAHRINFTTGPNNDTKEMQDQYTLDHHIVDWFTRVSCFCPKYWSLFDSWEAPELPDLILEKY